MNKKLTFIELFAGVGGFRIGLEKASDSFKAIWSNQWEPGKKNQFASDIYKRRFGSERHSNQDIATVKTSEIPDCDMVVGGFPCQDYSVARTLNQAQGIVGKKGVLWWEIYRILNEKKEKPDYLLFENVDRLLKSPAKQRGRDFAIMLASLSDLGYAVEWRVINAADYGMPQRRKRVYFLGYHKGSEIYEKMSKMDRFRWATESEILVSAFKIKPIEIEKTEDFKIIGTLSEITENFNKEHADKSPFKNAGLIVDREVMTFEASPKYDGPYTKLGDIILSEDKVPENFFIDESSLDKWKYLKGSKKEIRKSKTGYEYCYSEGNVVFPDRLDLPSRTIVTGEGGPTPSRFKHVIKTENGRLRRLTPIELERLNMFPDNHTEGATDTQRAFLMGNALVTGVVEQIGKALISKINQGTHP